MDHSPGAGLRLRMSGCAWRTRGMTMAGARSSAATSSFVDAITALLFDDRGRAQEQRRRNGDVQRLGGLEIDRQLERGRLLHGQVPRPRALEDLVDVAGRAPVHL